MCPRVRKECPSLLLLLNLGSIPTIAFSRYQALDWFLVGGPSGVSGTKAKNEAAHAEGLLPSP